MVVVFVLESKGLYSQLLHFTKTTETESSSRRVDLITPVRLNLNFRGPPFDFSGGGGGEGGVRVIPERKISCRLISRGKKSCKEISGGKKSYPEKRYLSWRIMLEKILTPLYVKKKNSITRGLGKVKSLPKPNPPYRPLPPPAPSPLPQKSYGRPL